MGRLFALRRFGHDIGSTGQRAAGFALRSRRTDAIDGTAVGGGDGAGIVFDEVGTGGVGLFRWLGRVLRLAGRLGAPRGSKQKEKG